MRSEDLMKVLEPKAGDAIYSHEEAIQLSIAISMKRIADAICGDENNTGIHRALVEMANPIPR